MDSFDPKKIADKIQEDGLSRKADARITASVDRIATACNGDPRCYSIMAMIMVMTDMVETTFGELNDSGESLAREQLQELWDGVKPFAGVMVTICESASMDD